MIVTVTLNPVLDRTLSVEEIRFNDVLRASQTRLDWGGKGLNVARAVKALGGEVIAGGLLGGSTGRMLADGLHALDIPLDFMPIAGETRTNIMIMDETNGRHIKVNDAGPSVSPAEVEDFVRHVQATVQPGDWWVLCGSLPPGAPADVYARLIDIVQSSGARAVLDTSGEALRLGCASKPYLVKPNREEARALTGLALNTEEELITAARSILKMGVQIAVISLGAEGLLACAEGSVNRIRPPQVSEKNPTGAGDALLAGLLLSLSQGYPLERAAKLGVASGSAAALKDGVSVGSPEEVARIYSMLDACHALPILPGYLMTSEAGSFARSTIVERKPKIIEQVMEDYAYPEGIVNDLKAFSTEITHQALSPIREESGDTAFWNRAMSVHHGRTWLELPWYFAETYFYRRLLECIRYLQPGEWRNVDPFAKQKERQIKTDIQRLAAVWSQFEDMPPEVEFEALLHSCLWGNRTDLSNFTVKVKAAHGLAAKHEEENIIINHTQAVHERLRSKITRVDFVNDNAGSDSLFDLALADFLLRQEWTGQVVFNLKDRPFFVSDAMIRDIRYSIEALREDAALHALAGRLVDYMGDKRLVLQTHPFWSSCLMFRQMPQDLSAEFGRSGLVIVKGDVNYRRMLDDRHWPYDTPIAEAADYFPAPFVLLRTLKGEIMLGLPPRQAQEIEKEDPAWLIDGQRGVIQMHPLNRGDS